MTIDISSEHTQAALARAGDVLLAPCAAPAVSIVICAYGKSELTLRCLEALSAHPPDLPFEVIVVDDASPDDTARVLSGVRHLVLVTNPVNLGFLHSANRGAGYARGEYLVLLNNDTEVTHGWLDALVHTADQDPSVGAVGARLVYPDGTLQEAGGIIFDTAVGWNYGRGEEPHKGEFGYVRAVDYCSGAALLVRTSLWRELAGFDEAFSPAYYEDTDLCFRIREAGYTVLYQPRSVVYHVEGASHGTDPLSGLKAHQVTNAAVFRAKWAHRLVEQQAEGSDSVLRARDRRCGPRVLIVDERVPTPDEDSGSVRMWQIIHLLGDLGCVVTLLPVDGAVRQPWLERLEQHGVEVLHGGADPRTHLTGLGANLKLVLLSRPAHAVRFLPLVREVAPQVPVIFDTVDLHFLRLTRQAAVQNDPGTARLADTMRELELALTRAADATLVVSAEEREILLGAVPDADVCVVSNIHEPVPDPPGPTGRNGMLLVGNFEHPPNADAARVLALDVLPLVRRSRPDEVIRLVGSRMPPAFHDQGKSAGVEVLGWLADLTDVHARSRVMVAPLRFGAGMKGKVGDALRYGLPVVTSAVGAEGLGLIDGHNALLAEGPADTARAVLRLMEDDELWSRISREGRRLVQERLSPDSARTALEGLLGRLGVS